MTRHNQEVFLEPIRTDISLYDTKEVAHTVQSILWDDLSRLHNADLDDLRTLCNPEDEAKVALQADKLSRAQNDTRYYGMYEPGDPDMVGIAKIAPWGNEYEKSFTSPSLVALKSFLKLDIKTAVGLDAFALKTTENRARLTRAALNSIYWDDSIVPANAALKAVVDLNDKELIEAFDELGATAHEKIATIHLNDWTRDYTLRTLPAKQRTARTAW